VRLLDPDVWWHLATGRLIVEHHAIPRVDPFSFTVAGAPWRGVDWLAELAMYGAQRLAGDPGVTLLASLAAFGALALLGLCLRELRVARGPAGATLLAVALLTQWRWSLARPLTLGALCVAAALYLIARASARRDRSALLLPLLCLAWGPIHPTVVLCAPLACALLLSVMLDRSSGDRAVRDRAVAGSGLGARGPAVWALVGVLGTAVVLAAGPGRLWIGQAFAVEGARLATELTIEWRRTSLGDGRVWAAGLLLLGGVAGAAGRWRRQGAWVLLALVGGALLARFVRNAAEAVLLGAPLFGLALERWARACERRGRRLLAASLPLLIAAALFTVQVAPAGRLGFNPRFGLGASVLYRPVQTFEALRALPDGRVMNDCTFGGWLIWQRVPVYCDGRTVTLYREADLERLWRPLYDGEAAVLAAAGRFGARYFLARAQSAFEAAMMRSPRFVPLAYDRESSLFTLREHASALPPEALALDELRFVDDPAWMDLWYAAVLDDATRRARLSDAVVAAYHACPDARALVGAIEFLRRVRPAEAAELRRALERSDTKRGSAPLHP